MFVLKNVIYKDILDINDLSIYKNRITCIVGHSGSGKTTLIRLLNKLISPDRGDISYDSVPLDKIDSVLLRRDCIMLPQSPIIYEGNIRDNLLIGLQFCEKNIISDSVLKEKIALMGMEKDLSENADILSGGEKQRICLLRVMLMDARMYILDEPSSALDKELEDSIMKNIVNFAHEQSKTLIIVTHSPQIAQKYADVLIHMSLGKIESVQEVKSL